MFFRKQVLTCLPYSEFAGVADTNICSGLESVGPSLTDQTPPVLVVPTAAIPTGCFLVAFAEEGNHRSQRYTLRERQQ